MNKSICIVFVSVLAATGLCSYTYEVYEYDNNSKTLENQQRILIDEQGGMYSLTLMNESSAAILGTSDIDQFFGGIWEIHMYDAGGLVMSGGQVHEISISNHATAFLSGGLIQQIWSYQDAWKNAGDPPAPIWNPHITIECLDHSYDTGTKFLTGHWLDSSEFSIQLIDVQGFSPTIENIQFIPEPTTMLLLGLGGLLIRRKK